MNIIPRRQVWRKGFKEETMAFPLKGEVVDCHASLSQRRRLGAL